MKRSTVRPFLATAVVCLALAANASAQTTEFTYQGSLNVSGAPATGNYDFEFLLFDAVSGGTQLGSTLSRNTVAVEAGVFAVKLDFGSQFPGANRFLEIHVRQTGGGTFTPLSPRQTVNSAPYAVKSLNATTADSVSVGGLPAGSGNYIQNSSTVQPTSNFNISGNGFVAGNVGVGTTSPVSKVTVQGNGYGFTHTNGTVTVGSFISSAAGGSGWLGTKSNHPLNFFTNDGLPQMTLDTSGNVGIGTSGQAAKLYVLNGNNGTSAVYGESPSGRALWGKSTGSIGVFGESTSLEGVFGVSSNAAGVRGASTTNSGVYGESPVSSLTAAGVFGKGTGSGSIGVIGESDINNAVGVFGVSTSPGGVGVYARNNFGGRSIVAEGNVAQDINSGGIAKAMVEVNFQGTILRCYNGINNTNSGNCGITLTQPLGGVGVYRLDFGIAISNRFFSVTAVYTDTFDSTNNAGVNYRVFNSTSVEVFTFRANDAANTSPRGFMLIMY